MELINYIKMPKPLMVLGLMYGLFASVCFIQFIKQGCYKNILSTIIQLVIHQYKWFIGLIIFILLVITFLDAPISNLCKSMYNINIYTAVDFINKMGEGWFIGGVLFTIYIILSTLGYQNYSYVYKIAFTTSIFAGLFNGVFKFIFNRERPSIGDDPWDFFHFFITGAKNPADLFYAYNSMPSGHTIAVVSALTVIFCCTDKIVYRAILVILGIAIMGARVYTINHWFSDVLTSCIMGVIIGYITYKLKLSTNQ